MKTELFRKKIFKLCVIITSMITVAFSFLYAIYLSKVKTIDTSKSFYYLVSTSTHIEASAHGITQMGGAGYYIEEEGKIFVALSVYTSQLQAIEVQKSLKNTSTEILSQTSPKIYLKSRVDKNRIQAYKNAFSLLDNWIRFLEREIARLEGGATQQSSKRILLSLHKQFTFASKEYESAFLGFSKICRVADEKLSNILQSVVYLKDLRYVLCHLCDSYLRLSEEF
ncbi:MAG: hypothetical protein E7381_06130, partial [Clostridiales bacterium]|nr:hypothetical protein [Clostridiales bacterium]